MRCDVIGVCIRPARVVAEDHLGLELIEACADRSAEASQGKPGKSTIGKPSEEQRVHPEPLDNSVEPPFPKQCEVRPFDPALLPDRRSLPRREKKHSDGTVWITPVAGQCARRAVRFIIGVRNHQEEPTRTRTPGGSRLGRSWVRTPEGFRCGCH